MGNVAKSSAITGVFSNSHFQKVKTEVIDANAAAEIEMSVSFHDGHNFLDYIGAKFLNDQHLLI